MEESIQIANTLITDHCGDKNFKFSIQRGLTCCAYNFHLFLEKISRLHFENANKVSKEVSPKYLKSSLYEIKVVIEDSHGSKLLQNGDIRIDFNCNGDRKYYILFHTTITLQIFR